jgi:hypothetical protein
MTKTSYEGQIQVRASLVKSLSSHYGIGNLGQVRPGSPVCKRLWASPWICEKQAKIGR